jgi:hypothetical protein
MKSDIDRPTSSCVDGSCLTKSNEYVHSNTELFVNANGIIDTVGSFTNWVQKEEVMKPNKSSTDALNDYLIEKGLGDIARGAGKAVGAAVEGVKNVGREFKSGAESAKPRTAGEASAAMNRPPSTKGTAGAAAARIAGEDPSVTIRDKDASRVGKEFKEYMAGRKKGNPAEESPSGRINYNPRTGYDAYKKMQKFVYEYIQKEIYKDPESQPSLASPNVPRLDEDEAAKNRARIKAGKGKRQATKWTRDSAMRERKEAEEENAPSGNQIIENMQKSHLEGCLCEECKQRTGDTNGDDTARIATDRHGRPTLGHTGHGHTVAILISRMQRMQKGKMKDLLDRGISSGRAEAEAASSNVKNSEKKVSAPSKKEAFKVPTRTELAASAMKRKAAALAAAKGRATKEGKTFTPSETKPKPYRGTAPQTRKTGTERKMAAQEEWRKKNPDQPDPASFTKQLLSFVKQADATNPYRAGTQYQNPKPDIGNKAAKAAQAASSQAASSQAASSQAASSQAAKGASPDPRNLPAKPGSEEGEPADTSSTTEQPVGQQPQQSYGGGGGGKGFFNELLDLYEGRGEGARTPAPTPPMQQMEMSYEEFRNGKRS